ncbi:hypothetical protein EVAR_26594_1 [Eumeta japonica]|uniref:Uncharacterized protein n=1 Tax=Eumeta variegata TaxID=151549 RepID=A0A4C1W6I8_EUMVA|nr:hypothetical protein EVAR_26594_1 [Eumeta japonica]
MDYFTYGITRHRLALDCTDTYLKEITCDRASSVSENKISLYREHVPPVLCKYGGAPTPAPRPAGGRDRGSAGPARNLHTVDDGNDVKPESISKAGSELASRSRRDYNKDRDEDGHNVIG